VRHDWVRTGASPEDEECAACGLARSRWFYLNLPGREPNQVYSKDSTPEPGCAETLLERVMGS